MEYIVSLSLAVPNKIAKAIEKEQKRLHLGYKGNYKATPHITLYLARYKKKNFYKLVRKLKSLVFKKIRVVLAKPKRTLNSTRERHFFFMGVKNGEEIARLHKQLVLIANSYRGGLIRNKDKKKIREKLYSRRRIRNIKKYGYSRVLDLFEPHITIGETENSGNLLQELGKKLNFIDNSSFIPKGFLVELYEYRERKGYKKIAGEEIRFSKK